ncbi:MAG: type II toxin-antitoxin system HicA family toxin [Chloroflexota bacterium]
MAVMLAYITQTSPAARTVRAHSGAIVKPGTLLGVLEQAGNDGGRWG